MLLNEAKKTRKLYYSLVFHFRRALPYAIDLSLSGSFQSSVKAESLE